MFTVTAPVKGYSGESVCGVVFTDGTAITDNPAALAYFRRRGYDISDGKPARKPRAKSDS
ncbi:hypothetical protein ACN95_14595 [Gordonia sihwensis]|uniref:hypothetical protein n=1 Tax=Gordonia sihwensis TaxID=173559 RepID=UPI001C92C74D|nr:hypothetical protein [Gordonia sihwensis]MBY4571246.1 hypothetical protein [Gordonia sihwensis]WFN91484.1 hypothetical protein P5P27_11895 [Gordonia sihwensis]WFN91542.1 hypothetical protein P5P27_12185 [Gordonia sihwensis]